MFLSYSEYRQLNEETEETIEFDEMVTEFVVSNIAEKTKLTPDQLEEVFTQLAEKFDLELTYEEINQWLEDSSEYIIETNDEEGNVFFELTETGGSLLELFGKKEDKKPPGLFHPGGALGKSTFSQSLGKGVGKAIGGAPKAFAKMQAGKANAEEKKRKGLMKHDYKMAKLSSKSKEGGFDNYAKLSGAHNARY